mmetsp:Transcript_328/g.747  ORF Transcript_328/g.747 Transcript_328/m.747 type:complete len:220 (-) Transcript_328:1153-1812(-)
MVPTGRPSCECYDLALNGCLFQILSKKSLFRQFVYYVINKLKKVESGETQKNIQQIDFYKHDPKVDCKTHYAVNSTEQVGKDPFYFCCVDVPFVCQGIVFFVRHIVIDGDEILLHGYRHRNHYEFRGQNSQFPTFSSVLFSRQVDKNNAVTKVFDENEIDCRPELKGTRRTRQHKGIDVFRKVDSFPICKSRSFQIDVDNIPFGIFVNCVVKQFRLKPL